MSKSAKIAIFAFVFNPLIPAIMKRIDFLAPVESMRGNLSGNQVLLYAENNNPAYEAPNGKQYARNYSTRYIGAKRSATNLKYFAVRTKNAATLNAVTRKNMALTGAVASIISRLMTTQSATAWTQINNAFNYLKSNNLLPEGVKTFRKWVDLNLRNMLKFNRGDWSFTQASITFVVFNPFDVDNDDAGVLTLPRGNWVKFAQSLAYNFGASSKSGIYFKADGLTMFSPFKATQQPSTFADILALENPNMKAQLSGLTVSGSNVLYNSMQLYTSAGVAVQATDIVAGVNYTTIAPTA